ncbi:GNAT family N-acetyltransferase [Pararhizobium qamdonense]|uniref:GNAT family N-acetyltransferase n=1 Tax=Pararhizobium qamdonense TaxID=3031126 RepID=UPI0023E3313E|nr:GNAT family N-acetyltransferase [Pararhizobium qamdonense]
MQLPDLAPDIRFPLLGPDECEFSFQVKTQAMGPHIKHHWGWDEEFQRGIHSKNMLEKPFSKIEFQEKPIGTISLQRCSAHFQFGEFYLANEFRGRGIGTAILRHCLILADGLRLPVRLEYLLWNPVGTLYRRHGFLETAATSTHYLMERPVLASKL